MVEFGKTHDGKPLHPGRILLVQAMEPLGISRNQLARDIDVPVGRISDITNGKRGVTADTALRLGRYFGTGPELWLRLQAEFDLYVARTTTWPAIESRVRVLETRPAASSSTPTDDKFAGEREEAAVPDLSPEPPISAVSAEPVAENLDDQTNDEPSTDVWIGPKPVSEFVPAEAGADERQLDDSLPTEESVDEDLGIPPVPRTGSRIVSG